MEVKIINKSKHDMPNFETTGASGMDIRANLSCDIILKPLERKLIPTGIFLELEDNFEAQVRARSGLAIKKGISLVNGIGTIDSDYRGEVKVILINLSNEEVTIKDGDRIAQIVFMKVEKPKIIEVKNISDTERGSGGFGHTGI